MRNPTLPRACAPVVAAVAILAATGTAHALGEKVVDVRVMGAVRTDESTVRSIAGIRIGDVLENESLSLVRERLNTTGLFADVNVWWENWGEGVRVNIAVKDKFPWAPVPTGSWSSTNKSIGLLFVHGNLFGWGKQLAVGGRLAQLDSGALLAYRDPALFQTWLYWELKGIYQRQIIPEYAMNAAAYNAMMLVDPSSGALLTVPEDSPWRQTTYEAFGFEPVFGINWFRRVRTQVAWRFDKVKLKGIEFFDPATNMLSSTPTLGPGPPTSIGGTVGVGR